MISVDEAIAILVSKAPARPTSSYPLAQSSGRILAETIRAKHSQPAKPVSAMDGYAVRFSDIDDNAVFTVIGEAPAGSPFDGCCGAGQAVRLFTGSVVPDGADHVVIQEDVARQDNCFRITQPQPRPRNIRAAGIDFQRDQILAKPGDLLDPFLITAIASAGYGNLTSYNRPRVGIIANGDELKEPGETLSEGDVVCSTPYGLMPLIDSWGADAHFTGIAEDAPVSITSKIDLCSQDDLLLPIGGASVGDHDHMRSTFLDNGWNTIFEKIAVKPGKPTWFASNGEQLTLGLPGNPASALVCAILFLKPVIFAMTGRNFGLSLKWRNAPIRDGLPSNGGRESFLRARKSIDDEGKITLAAAQNQDSSLITPFLDSDVLIRRPAHAPAVDPDSTETVPYLDIL